ncbi:phage portal protein, partial [Escherichia coli]
MSMYTTAQLLAANEQKFKFDPLFLRLFFRESYPFTTEKVYLSQIPGLVNMALYVSPIVSGEVIRSRGGSTSEFTPGYVKPKQLTGWIGEIAAYYAAAPVRLGGAKVPHLMPGDSLNLQTAQDTDNGYSVFEQSLLRYIAAGLGVSYEQLSRNYAQMSYSTARASANESWAYFMGRRKFVASRQASQMFLCWLEEAIVRRVVTLPSKARFSFQEARSAWGNCDWIGSGRMAIDGLKEVQEAVMLIEAGLSTYEKECAKRGDDYQEIFAQQVRETMERRAAGLKPPAWAAAAFESGLRQSTEEEK